MDDLLTEEQLGWRNRARSFAQAEITPISLERDQIEDPRDTFDWEIIKKGSRLGLRTAALSKEWGGHEIDSVTQVLVITELARADCAISKTFSQCWKWSSLLARICTPEQKDRFLKPFVEDDTFLLGYAGTEPHSGSDNRTRPGELGAGWMLRAERDGDEWVLNGTKRYIANGSVAKLFLVGARTDPTVLMAEGGTLFLVPADTPGLRIGKVYDKVGWRFYQNAELIFDDVRVPALSVVGEVGQGVRERQGGALEFNEVELAATAIGVCDAAIAMAMEQARTRWQGGAYIIEHQAIQLKLAEMHMLTEALRSLVLRAAALADRGKPDKVLNALAMNFSSDAVQRVTHLNVDIHGGAGVMRDVGAEKLARDAMVWTHLAGDSVHRFKAIKALA